MLFVESQFVLLFLPLVFFLHESLRKLTSQVWFLIGASLLFYGAWNPWLLILLTGSVCINYMVSRGITDGHNRWLFIVGLLLNLAPLFYFKYSGLVAQTAGLPFTTGFFGETLGKLLPLGISFFTFQQIAYLSDVHTKQVQPPSFEKYALFIAFFPQLIAGPIVHHSQFVPQVKPDRERSTLLIAGLFLFAIGFIKKTQIADNLAHFVDPLYAMETHTLSTSLKAMFGYTFQLYFDFSGYSDMALGLAAMFGFRLPQNFNSPYKSHSITEFWRRWHMTLSNWLRDYVYIPLGGNRQGPVRTYVNLLLTMLIGGLWHGASWTFVLWGGLHGLMLALERMWKSVFPRFSLGPLTVLPTFLIAALLWVLFRAENFETAQAVYSGFLVPDMPKLDGDMLLIALAAALCFFPNSNWYAEKLESWAERRNFRLDTGRIAARFAVYWSVAFAAAVTLMAAFYTGRIDRTAYRLVAVDDGAGIVSNKDGDFRSNFYSKRIFEHDGPKVFIVGSSFSRGLGSFEFEHDGTQFRSTSMGIGGNGFVNSLRSAYALLDVPNTHTIIMSASALNFGNTVSSVAFKTECVRPVSEMLTDLTPAPLMDCEPYPIDRNDFIAILAMKPSDERFLQFQNFAYLVTHAYERTPYALETLDLNNAESLSQDVANLIATRSARGEFPKNLENGNDARFKWNERRVPESLQAHAAVGGALKALKEKADSRGIRLVVYDTPTVSHTEMPDVYPRGFFEAYQRELRTLLAECGIDYYDLSDVLPWTRGTMMDFIHPVSSLRPEIHKILILELFTDTSAIEDAKEWKK